MPPRAALLNRKIKIESGSPAFHWLERHACTINRLGTVRRVRPRSCPPNAVKRPPAVRLIFVGAPVTAECFFESRNVSYSSSGEAFKAVRLIYSGDGRFTTWIGEKVVQRTSFSVDPSKKPTTFDAVIQEGEVKGKSLKGTTIYGIYELNGDTRKLCYVIGSKEDRPTDFASKPGSGVYLEVLKRSKD